jgi:GTP-binding protein
MEAVLAEFADDSDAEARAEQGHPRVAIVGRPNVGKSTLVNSLVGEERVIAFDQPGTTRDSIEVPFERGGRRYTLIDTAGLRQRVEQTARSFPSSRPCNPSRTPMWWFCVGCAAGP